MIGTTGFNKIQLKELKNLTKEFKVGVVYAPNISVGVNILLLAVKMIAKLLPHYDVEITEFHHRFKKDAPSGTAMKIATAINDAKSVRQPSFVFGRYGTTKRLANEIGIHAVRAGGIIGVHKVLFSNNSDEIEVIHRSYSRSVFAEGTQKAIKFIANHQGFYNMEDILLAEEKDFNKTPRISANFTQWWNKFIHKSLRPQSIEIRHARPSTGK